MILSMLEDVERTTDEKNIDKDERYDALMEELGIRLQKMQDMQVNSNDSLEKEHVMRTTRKSYYMPPESSHASKARSGETAKPELPNPNHDPNDTGNGIAVLLTMHNGQDSPSAAAMSFANIQFCNYPDSHDNISSHPEILCESEATGLLVEAVETALDGSRDGKTRELMQQPLVLKFCSMLGCNGMMKFFKHMTTPAGQACMIFMDVEERYGRILKLSSQVSRGEKMRTRRAASDTSPRSGHGNPNLGSRSRQRG
ncbi:Hsp90 co-chaperone Cdc37 [Metarhizium acridum CQMa 102]|uniref:Hsp90 co-chaperone Cdc37 n=1 Tax=Metarhizium acridum (strain CQMa 102) TaxID=655827 RepID=E9E3R9_METAQ|nr:Hsp90 co-chaperone Cdc37 [Metarhizium acridum CQMa 102]EFY89494.1 Hsp90 co-chaperone Cdc37 [Metarhizium acridum CQMa 102]